MKKNTETMPFGILILFLCCYFMKLLAFPNVLTAVIGAGLCLVMVLQQKRIRIDAGICLLALAMVSYYVIVNGVRGLFFTILYLPLIFYVLANYAVCGIREENDFEKKFRMLLFALVLGTAVYGVLNSYMYYAGYVVPGTRRWQDFWTGEIVPGTQHTASYLPVFAMFFPAVLYFKERKVLNAVLILGTVFFGYSSLATRSRMSVVIFAIVFCLQASLFVWQEREKMRKLVSNRKTWIVGAVLLIGLIVGIFLVKDSPVVVAFIENMGKGGGILNNVRFSAQRNALSQLFVYPMGGRQMDLGRDFCHNTWLDMANAGGLIPFVSFTLYTVFTLYELIRFLAKKGITPETKLMTAGLYAAFFLYLSVEPALDASVHLVTPWIFVNGMVHGAIGKTKRS